MNLVSVGNGLYICLTIYEIEVSFALGPPPSKFWDLPPAQSVINSQPTTVSIIGKRCTFEILRLFSCKTWLSNNALLSIFPSRRHIAKHLTVSRRRQVDVTHKWPSRISDPSSMGSRPVQLAVKLHRAIQ